MDERSENLQMWEKLGIDVERHCDLMALLRQVYPDVYMSQRNRPPAMAYFDSVIAEVHGDRIRELLEHKAAGGKVVGTFCVYVPDELIYAAGAVPVGLCGGAQFSVPDAEALLPRNICPLIKSFVGFKLSRLCPYFETCDMLVGETTCDGKKKTWEIMEEYAPIHVMEVPHRKGEKERELWLAEVWRLKTVLEELTGNEITPDTLAEGIRLANAKRQAISRLYATRKHNPPPISGKDALLVSQVAFYDDCARFTRSTNTVADQCEARAKEGVGVVDSAAPRIVVSGCPMAVPNWKLHHVLETSGAVSVAEETCTGTRYFSSLTDDTEKTLDGQMKAVAERHLKTNCACFTPNQERIQDVITLVQDWGAKGVIHYTLQFCHAYNIESVKMRKALEAAGIPVLSIESDYSMDDVGQLQTRIEAFLEKIS